MTPPTDPDMTQDVSGGQGYHDAATGAPARADEAPDPDAYREGWAEGVHDTATS